MVIPQDILRRIERDGYLTPILADYSLSELSWQAVDPRVREVAKKQRSRA